MRPFRGRTILAASALAAAVAGGVVLLAPRRADPVALLARAQADFQAGRLDEARRALDRLASLRPPSLAADHGPRRLPGHG